MTYQALDTSVQDAQPIYKFLFSTDLQDYMYTTAPYFISDSNGTWEPAPIKASEIAQNNELAKNGIQVELPRTNAVADLFLGKTPERSISVTVYRGFEPTDLEDFKVYWKGRVISAEADVDSVKLSCQDIFTSLRRTGNRARYQKTCRHALYSSACGVNQSLYGQNVIIEAVNDFVIVLLQDSNTTLFNLDSNDDYYVGGIIELSDGRQKTITEQSGEILTIIQPFNNFELDSGETANATIYPGCKHNVSDCQNKFNNIFNFGGFPYIPFKNPFSSSVTGSIV